MISATYMGMLQILHMHAQSVYLALWQSVRHEIIRGIFPTPQSCSLERKKQLRDALHMVLLNNAEAWAFTSSQCW